MNSRLYRVIFNKTLGQLVVVSEKATAQGKAGAQGGSDGLGQLADSQTHTSNNIAGVIHPAYAQWQSLRASILVGLGLAISVITPIGISQAHADIPTKIIADPSANKNQQPTVLNTASGLTQVNIQTPSAAGVSVNNYSQFDVGQKGAILNNSRSNVNTQTAGWVEGNPWLAKGEARIILNQVNSTNPSQLAGYTEIAGKKAELVIANPAGITCSGCGFINAARTTLTTGTPTLSNGSLTGFDVNSGTITVDGSGGDTRQSDYTQLIGQSVKLNANMHAKQLDVITGNNQVSYEADPSQTKVTAKTPTTATNQPTGVALDISSLGGMYAGKIRLIGTDKGMGVTNAGSVNASDTLTLDNQGNLSNSGSLIATQAVNLNTPTQIDNSGTIASSQSDVSVNGSTLTNSGLISSSHGQANLAPTQSLQNSGTISAGQLMLTSPNLTNSGRLEQTGTGSLTLNSPSITNKDNAVIGQSLYPNAPASTAPSTTSPPSTASNGNQVTSSTDSEPNSNPTTGSNTGNNTGTNDPVLPPVTANGSITAQNLTNQTSNAIITSNGPLLINTNQLTNQNQSSIVAQSLNTDNSKTDNQVTNANSHIQLPGVNWTLASFNNQGGQLISSQGIQLNTGSLDNSGGTIATTGASTDTSPAGDIQIHTGTLNNQQGVIQTSGGQTSEGQTGAAPALTISSDSLNNQGGHLSASGDLTLNSGDSNNRQGSIASQHNATLTTGNLDNTDGQIQAANQLNLTSQDLNNAGSGQIYGGSQLALTAANINNTGLIGSGGHSNIHGTSLTNTGTLAAGLNADGTLNSSAAPANLSVNTTGNLTSHGTHVATGNVSLQGNPTDLSGSSTTAGTIDLQSAGDLSTQNASLTATDTLTLSAGGTLNNTDGKLAGNHLALTANRLDNTRGSISQTSSDDLSLNLPGGIINQQGVIASNSNNLTLSTSNLNNQGGQISHAGAGQLALSAQSVDNSQQGQVLSLGEQVWQVTGDVNNNSGFIQGKRFAIAAGNVDNTQGSIAAVAPADSSQVPTSGSTLAVTGNLNNSQGQIGNSNTGSAGDVILNAQTLNNDAGSLAAGHDLSVTANQLSNSGVITAANQLTTHSTDLNNSGSLYGTTTAVNSQTLSNSGSIAAATDVAVQTGSLNQATSGQIVAGLGADNQLSADAHSLNLTSSGDTTNAGTLLSSGQLNANTATLTNTGSVQAKDVGVNASTAFNNDTGHITGDTLSLTAPHLSNQQGEISANQTLGLHTDTLNNQAGSITQAGTNPLSIGVTDLNNDNGFIGSNASDMSLKADSLSNQGGQIVHAGSGNLSLTAKQYQGDSGVVTTNHQLSLTGGDFNANHSITQAGSLAANVNHLTEQNAQLVLTDGTANSTITASTFDNSGAALHSQNQQLTLNTDTLTNTGGRIEFVGTDSQSSQLTITSNHFDNSQGGVVANTDATINAGQLNNNQGSLAAQKNLTISSDLLNNTGSDSQISSGNALQVTVQTLNNEGVVQSGASATFAGGTLNNQGSINSQAGLNLNSDRVNNQGVIYSQDSLSSHNAQLLHNAGNLAAQGDIALNANRFEQTSTGQTLAGLTPDNQLVGNHNLAITTAAEQSNAGLLLATGAINSQGSSVTNSGQLQAKTIGVTASTGITNDNGSVSADTVNLTAPSISNQKGVISANQTLDLATDSLNNHQGNISHLGKNPLTLAISNINNSQGFIGSTGQDLTFTNQTLDNTGGTIEHDGSGALTINATNYQGAGGKLITAQHLNLAGDTLNLDNTNTQVGSANISANQLSTQNANLVLSDKATNSILQIAGELNNAGGNLASQNSQFSINAGSINNQGGQLQFAGTSSSANPFTVTSLGTINNSTGNIVANSDAAISAGQLNNNQGSVSSANNLTLNTGVLNNTGSDSQISSGQALHLTAQSLTNAGVIQSGSTADIHANTLTNSGSIQAQADLSVKSDNLTNQGMLYSQGNTQLSNNQALHNAGNIGAANDITVTTGSLQQDSSGQLVAGLLPNNQLDTTAHTLSITSSGDQTNAGLNMASGQVTQQGNSLTNSGSIQAHTVALSANSQVSNDHGSINADTVNVTAPVISNQQGSISANQTLGLATDTLNNHTGSISHLGTDPLTLTINHIDNSQGVIGSNAQDFTLTSQTIDNTGGTIQHAGTGLLTITSPELTNSQGVISGNRFAITADNLNNQGGQIAASGQDSRATSTLTGATQLINDSGIIASNHNLAITGYNQLSNDTGLIQTNHGSDLTLKQIGTLTNSNSLGTNPNTNTVGVVSSGNLNVTTNRLTNQNNQIVASNQLNINSDTLTNTAGQLLANNQVNINATNQLTNSQGGDIASLGDAVTINTGNLSNTGSGINAAHDLTVTASNGLDNSSGRLSGDTVTVNSQAGTIHNNSGVITGNQLNLNAPQAVLDNTGGLIQQQGNNDLQLTVAGLINNDNLATHGGIFSNAGLVVNTVSLQNNAGAMRANQDVTLTTPTLSNNAGRIVSGHDLTINSPAVATSRIDNIGGVMYADHDANLTATNSNGSAVLNNQATDTQAGFIEAGNHLTLSANQLTNANAQRLGNQATLKASSIQVTADTLDNSNGVIAADNQATLQVANQLNNTAGSISAGTDLAISGTPGNNQLNVLNNAQNGNAALLQAGNDVNLTAKQLQNNGGTIQANHNVTTTLLDTTAYTNGGQGVMRAGNQLSFSTAGDFINQGALAANNLSLSANQIDNQTGASIQSNGKTQLTASNITNQGLINGDTTLINASGTLNNQSNGRIYGTHLSIAANTINNSPTSAADDSTTAAPIIAARDRLDLAAITINNNPRASRYNQFASDFNGQAKIFSGGNLYVGGSLDSSGNAVGQAQAINNVGATIESLGDMSLSAKQIKNANTNYQISSQLTAGTSKDVVSVVTRRGVNIPVTGDGYCADPTNVTSSCMLWGYGENGYPVVTGALYEQLKNNDFSNVSGDLNKFVIGSADSWNQNHTATKYFDETRYTQVTQDQQTLTSDPSQIVSGGNLILNADGFTNDKSQVIVGKDIVFTGNTLSTDPVKAMGDEQISYQNSVIRHFAASASGVEQANPKGTETVHGVVDLAILQNGTIAQTLKNQNQTGSSEAIATPQVAGGSNSAVSTATANTSAQANSGSAAQASIAASGQVQASSGPTAAATATANAFNALPAASKTAILAALNHPEQISQLSPADYQALQNLIQTQTGGAAATSSKDVTAVAGSLDKQSISNVLTAVTPNSQTVTAASLTPNAQGIASVSTPDSQQVRTQDKNYNLPASALYNINPNSQASYLVQTDPAFTNASNWLSSDYMLQQLNLDPVQTQKRLGDGFYEQQLINDQVHALTGRRYIGDYQDDTDEYKALMNQGVAYAKQFNLRPGVALTAEQMQNLTDDMVWLVEKTVTLPNGTKTTALVPQLYVVGKASDLTGDGSLMSSQNLYANAADDFNNNATIATTKNMYVSAKDINNQGRMQADVMGLKAENDITNNNRLSANRAMALTAGGNVNIASTLGTATGSDAKNSTQTNYINRQATVTVGSDNSAVADGTSLRISAGKDINVTATNITNHTGDTQLTAGQNVNFNALTTGTTESHRFNGATYGNYSQSQDVGSSVTGAGNLGVNANNITGTAATLQADKQVNLQAAQDITLNNGWNKNSGDSASRSARWDSHNANQTSIAGQVSGDTVVMNAGHDLTLTNQKVQAVNGMDIHADHDVNLAAATNSGSHQLKDHTGSERSSYSTDMGTSLTNQNNGVSVTAGNNITGVATKITNANGNTVVQAGNDVSFTAGRDVADSSSNHQSTQHKWYGSKKINESNSSSSDTAITSDITGTNVAINAKNGNVSLVGTNVQAVGLASVTADKGTVLIQSAVDENASQHTRTTSNFYKNSASDSGHDTQTLHETGITGGSVYVNGSQVAVNGAKLQANTGNVQVGNATLATDDQGRVKLNDKGKPIVLAGDAQNVSFGTVDLKDHQWNNSSSSYKGIAKVAMQAVGVVGGALGVGNGVTLGKGDSHDTTTTQEAVSTLTGKNVMVGGSTVTAKGTVFNATADGGSIYALGNNVDLGVATTTKAVTDTHTQDKITGEGVRVNKDSLQLGAVVDTNTRDSTTTTTTTHQGAQFNGDNIVALGNTDNGSLTTTATQFNFNKQTGSLLAGAKTTHFGGIEDTTTVTHNNTTDTTRASVDVHHAAVDVAVAGEKLKDATKDLNQARNELNDAKARVAKGELAPNAIKDYEANLAAATVNVANAEIGLGSSAAAINNSWGMAGFSATGTVQHSHTQSNDSTTTGKWQGTTLNGNQATLVGDDFTGQGVGGNLGSLNIANLDNFKLTAGTNTSSSFSSSRTDTQTGSMSTTGNTNVSVSHQQSNSNADGVTYTNSLLKAGELNGYAKNTDLNGALVIAGGGDYTTGNLHIQTAQDTASSHNSSQGGNLGIGFSKDNISSVSIGANHSNGSSNSLMSTQQSGIIYTGADHKLTVTGTTTDDGGILAHVVTDANGNQSNGTLNFTTNHLITQDLVNTKTSDQRNIGVNVGVGNNANGTSLNTIGVQAGHTGQDYQSVTHATIGDGAEVTNDAITGNNSLANVNRDALNTTTVIKNMQTGGLNTNASIDGRVLTSAGRAQILDEQQKLPDNLGKAGALGAVGALAIPGVVVGLFDQGNSDPNSQSISGFNKVKSNLTMLGNGVGGSMNDANRELMARVKAVENGDNPNAVNDQATDNALHNMVAKGTAAAGTQINLVDNPTNINGKPVYETTNVTNHQDTYFNTDTSDHTVNSEFHASAHQNGEGETAASYMGWAGNIAVKAGMWANQDNIDAASQQLKDNPTPIIAGVNDAEAQQKLLNSNKAKLKTQQKAGDKFENEGMEGFGSGWVQDANAYSTLADYQFKHGASPSQVNQAIDNAHYYTSDAQVKTGRYVLPTMQTILGVAGTVGSIRNGSWKAAGVSFDQAWTGASNFGKDESDQEASIGLERGLGVPRDVAATILLVDGAVTLASSTNNAYKANKLSSTAKATNAENAAEDAYATANSSSKIEATSNDAYQGEQTVNSNSSSDIYYQSPYSNASTPKYTNSDTNYNTSSSASDVNVGVDAVDSTSSVTGLTVYGASNKSLVQDGSYVLMDQKTGKIIKNPSEAEYNNNRLVENNPAAIKSEKASIENANNDNLLINMQLGNTPVTSDYAKKVIKQFWNQSYNQSEDLLNSVPPAEYWYPTKLVPIYTPNGKTVAMVTYAKDGQYRATDGKVEFNLEPIGEVKNEFDTSVTVYGTQGAKLGKDDITNSGNTSTSANQVTNSNTSNSISSENQINSANNDTFATVCGGINCFTAGTLIETKDGLKPIEAFTGGEFVWSRDEISHEFAYRPVIATKRTENQVIFKVTIKDSKGNLETLETTAEHPFWVKDFGWVKASLLSSGMKLLDRNNEELEVVNQYLINDRFDTVYNISVDEFSTYHVGKLGTWVHNDDCCNLANQPIATETKRGVINNGKLTTNSIALDMTPTTSAQAQHIASNGDPSGALTETLFENVVQEQGGKVLTGGKYGSNNGYDHVVVFQDAEGNTTLTMTVDSKQVGKKGVVLDNKAAGGTMQMSNDWDTAVLAKLDPNSEAYMAIRLAQVNGTLVKGVAYVDKSTGQLKLVRIDPTTRAK